MGDEDEIPRVALAAGGVSRSRRFGARRSPTTGHRIRRPQTPEPGHEDAKPKQVKRSLSSPGEYCRNFSSTSEEDEDYDRKKISKENINTKSGENSNLKQITPKSDVEIKKETLKNDVEFIHEDNLKIQITALSEIPAQLKKTTEDETNKLKIESKDNQQPLKDVPKPVLRKRIKGRPKLTEEKVSEPSSEDSKDASISSPWWKSWQNWGTTTRGKSLEREPGSETPKAVPRRRNKSLTRPASNKKRNETHSLERIPTNKEKGDNTISKEKTLNQDNKKVYKDKRKLLKERTSFDDSSDEFWKPSSIESALIRLGREIKEIKQENKPQKTPKKYLKLENAADNFHDKEQPIKIREQWKLFLLENAENVNKLKRVRNKCVSSLIILMIYCGLGGFMFRYTEGAFENFYKCGVKRVKRDFIDNLWSYSHNLREEDWKSLARRKLMMFEEQLFEAFEAGSTSYSGQRSWSFLNSVVYCLSVVTTIGYGHIAPVTTTGRVVTIIYAIFGIPIFLILLADFGKLFTRGIKFVWAFVRRVYYTGSCRKVRRTVPVQEMMKGVQMVYDIATFRRPSQIVAGIDLEGAPPVPPRTPFPQHGTDPPGTPALSTFEVDDEFNLPISVAITILIIYILCGALVFCYWEGWGFFESFYFVFISMSTIGFGDFVPRNQMYMMASIIYLVFGLALTSMCINVVQEKLSDTFRQASAKIGATIGLQVADEDGAITPAKPKPVEIAEVHKTAVKASPEQFSSSSDIQETKNGS